MVRAVWNGAVIAKSDDTVVVEGNHYFPADSVREDLLVPSDHHTTCGWKGRASYHTLAVGGRTNKDAAWYYPDPKPAAEQVRGRIAFWRGVTIEVDPAPAASRPTSEAATAHTASFLQRFRSQRARRAQ